MNARLAMMLVGTELVRARLTDTNHGHIGRELESIGVEMSSVHVVEDDAGFASELLKWLSPQVDYVITVGGLGPTVDDITMAAVARAFDLSLEESDPATPADFAQMSGSETRRNRLRHFPAGAEIICTAEGPVVHTRNVFSLPGLPRLVAARLPAVLQRLEKGRIDSRMLCVDKPQSAVARLLEAALEAYPGVSIGCYPAPDGRHTKIELIGSSEEELENCLQLLRSDLGITEDPGQ